MTENDFPIKSRTHQIVRLLIFNLLLLCSTQLASSGTPSEDAVVTAKEYVMRLSSGNVMKAVSDYWQTDTLLSGSFGLVYLSLPEADKAQAQTAFADFVAAPFANERVSAVLKSIVVKEAIPTVIDESTIAVRMQLEGDSGRFRTINTLLLVKTKHGWRITDQRQGDQPSIRVAVTMTYMGSAKAPSDTIPGVLERAAAETRKQMSGK